MGRRGGGFLLVVGYGCGRASPAAVLCMLRCAADPADPFTQRDSRKMQDGRLGSVAGSGHRSWCRLRHCSCAAQGS